MILSENALYIKYIRLKEAGDLPHEYPYTVPALAGFSGLRFRRPVTFIVGENGMGKSTLLEAIAVKAGFNAEGGSKNFRFATRETHSPLYGNLVLGRGLQPRDGYFLRAESFYNVATEIDQIADGIHRYYGDKSLHRQSHGESFLSLLEHRLRGNGLYIFDEPEAALSVAADVYAVPDKTTRGKRIAVHRQHPLAYRHGLPRRRHLRDRGQRAATHRTGANAALPADETLLPRPRRYAPAVGVRHPGILKRGSRHRPNVPEIGTTAQAFRTDAAQDLHGRLARILPYEFDGTDITTGTSAHEKSRLRVSEPGFL